MGRLNTTNQKTGGSKHQIAGYREKKGLRLRLYIVMHGIRLGGPECVRWVTAPTALDYQWPSNARKVFGREVRNRT